MWQSHEREREKMKNKIIKALGIVALTSAFLITSVNASSLASKSLATNNQKYLATAMVEAYGDNYDEWLKNNLHKADLSTKVNSLMKSHYGDIYPAYFGGMYISDDSLNLVIQIVEENIPIKGSEEYSVYKEIIDMDSTIKIEYVKNSYNELNKIKEEISKYFSPNEDIDVTVLKNISANYVDIYNNTVVVRLVENTEKTQMAFKQAILVDSKLISAKANNAKISDSIMNKYSELIKFEQGDLATTTADLKPGGLINIPLVSGGPTAYECSMGFRTKYNGKAGYITAGHCVSHLSIGATINTGTVKYKQFTNEQAGDYAFIETSSSWTPINTLAFTSGSITTLHSPQPLSVNITAGMAIAKAGNKTGYTAGTVKYSNVDVTYVENGVATKIKSLFEGTIKVNCGDSGGVVFKPDPLATIPLGVQSGASWSNPNDVCNIPTNTAYFTNIDTMFSAFRTGRY